jgi:TDG/mug DNA glycosylase family protein
MIGPVNEVPDLVRPGLSVLFCGINPGVLSGQLGQHFARPGNRFWKVLHGAGFTDRLLEPSEQGALLDFGVGITNLVARPSKGASDLSAAELRSGAVELAAKAAVLRPQWVAVVGVQAYRVAFGRPRARVGRQDQTIGAGSGLWVLPNPSGLQARYQLPEMIEMFAALRAAISSAPPAAG